MSLRALAQQQSPGFLHMFARLIERGAQLYPFFSGAGRFANSALFRALDPPGGEDRIVKTRCGGWAVIPAGDHVGRAMRFVGDLDPKVSWVLDRVLDRGDVALDIGANLGLVSLRMAARVGPTGHVHSFEPQPRMLDYLRQTQAKNPGLPLTLHPVALGPEEKTMTMHIPDGNAGAGSLSKSSAEWQEVAVPVKRLDDYAKVIGIDRVDVIKLDVEGFEAQVLQGAMGIIGRTKPRVIILEENRPHRETGMAPALRMLQEAGYDLFALPRQFLSVNLVPLAENRFAHDFVGISKTADETLYHALGLQNHGPGRPGRSARTQS